MKSVSKHHDELSQAIAHTNDPSTQVKEARSLHVQGTLNLLQSKTLSHENKEEASRAPDLDSDGRQVQIEAAHDT